MNKLEPAIRRLTQPINEQFPRPWMTDMASPEKARVFIVGRNQAKVCPATLSGGHEAFIDALFNRNGKSCRQLYEEITGSEGPSRTRPNIDAFRQELAKFGVNNVLETNVICYSTRMSTDLSHVSNGGGRPAGKALFVGIVGIIRPPVIIAHGAETNKELARVFRTDLPSPPKFQADGVRSARVHTQLFGDAYAPMIFVIPPLAPPAWNTWPERQTPKWHTWAQLHFAEVCSQVRSFLDAAPGPQIP
jgi:hypothetical protein